MNGKELHALASFVAAVGAHYGDRLHDILVFGSRARGDARTDSDVDVAVILEDGIWRFSREAVVLADLAYPALMDAGLSIQPVPIARTAWEQPERQPNRTFLEAVRSEACPLQAVA